MRNDVDIVDRMCAASLCHEDLQYGWLAEAIDEIVKLRAAAEENKRYKTAIEWLETIYFSHHWDGCLNHPAIWHVIGWRPRLEGDDLLSAIEFAIEAAKEK